MTALATDNFNRANSGGLGGNWTQDGHANNFTISSNTAVPSAFNDDAGSFYTAITWPNDHYSKAAVTATGTVGGDQGIGVSVRHSGFTATVNYYVLAVDHAASGNVGVLKNVAATYGHVATATQAFTDGDVWELDIVGTTLTVKLNGATVTSATDSSVSTGNAGVYYSSVSGTGSLDNWEGGDFASSGLPPGLGPDVGMTEPMLQAAQAAMMR